tara:strand:+ start:2441 stop:3304 length:864 start_codon:yes stop_codon:yes gene_type:complete
MDLQNGNCLELMKKIADKSIDLFICDLPYGETNCKWDCKIDMEQFWLEFKRIRKSKRTACIHFCSTKFGYELIKSWEGGFKMDMVWKKRNKTGGLQSRHRPMRNHEMVYFFYEQAPKYNRDTYHKRIQAKKEHNIEKDDITMGKTSKMKDTMNQYFDPPNPASVIEPDNRINEKNKSGHGWDIEYMDKPRVAHFDPKLPVSILEEDDPVTLFESTKVFIGKRHHQTEKPQDILEFFLKYWTDEGDTVLDPTMGSGSTGVACKKLNRKFIGFELNDDIYKTAVERITK